MSPSEASQKTGIDGVVLAKRFLESTTWIDLPFDAYDNGPVCTLRRLDGKKKCYDLMGSVYTDPNVPLFVEVKNYTTVGGQPEEYWEFLANAYSVTANDIAEDGTDAKRQFMWITKHPFAQSDWPTLTKASRVKKAVEIKHPEVLGDHEIDTDLVSIVSKRIWLIVFNDRQSELLLSPEELSLVESKLNRKRKK